MSKLIRRCFTPIAALGLIAAAATGVDAQTDSRWRAWTGCWAPTSAQVGLGPAGTVCVLPTDKASAVEVVTVVGSTITDRTRIDADGAERAVSRDGCTGSERARWSVSGTRVLITETLACEGGAERRGSGIMSFTQNYEWLDVRGMASGPAAGVAVARYRMLTDTAGLPAEVRAAVTLRGATATDALLAASAPLTLADIADVGTSADSGVATTWLMERTRDLKLTIDARQLMTLADQGVPGSVIDVVVALAHPKVFALNAGNPSMVPREPTGRGTATQDYWRRYPSYYGIYYSPFYDPWYSMYAGYYSPYYGYYGYRSGFGYNPYSPYSGYGWYSGYQPIVVVSRPSEEEARPHGRVVRGRGYTSGRSGDGESGKTVSAPSSSSGSSSTGSGSSGSAASGGSSGGGGGGDRTAVRKPPM